ncbi:lipoprotein [Mycoplasma mycoides subsp. capri]|uniref:lipoprotein n=1 Tax=Mycoplasma mycoides TaxID=2102 RepID=UPI002240BF46|nr:lipoprotein [Mycoplasma mycoides]QVJ96583.1 lipoprotein [Mycoplasma mycoides subsp. capri]QVJ97474.1 lipoprotein [Mycoplasma mycoides subsp. capri]QVK00466.1 lipoprotein [Mycoplasma mycoides subsp. capri]QVK01353.1 lipoprotein [Mycoplasma mycoides subsp. capri]
MKKLLTILGSIILITTTSTAVIACKNIKQLELKNKKTEQDKKESIESIDNKQKEKAKESENDSKPNGYPQGDQPHNDQPSDLPRKNNEELVKNSKINFDLIKKYGKEFSELFSSLPEDKAEKISADPKNTNGLTIAGKILNAYEELNSYSNFDDFQSKLKEKLNKSESEFSNFISTLEKDWTKIVKDYENEKENILKLLKETGK